MTSYSIGNEILKEIKELKSTKSASEIARLTKCSKTSTWRYLNDISRLPFDFILKLEDAGLIKPLQQIFKEN